MVMEKIVAESNVARYRELLASEGDEKQRRLLKRLLAEEESKLQSLLTRESE